MPLHRRFDLMRSAGQVVWQVVVMMVVTTGRWSCHGINGDISLHGASGDVIALTDSNFVSRLSDIDLALVKFYAPHCGHCQQLEPEFLKAAVALKDTRPSITLAEVNCAGDGRETCSSFEVSGYPSIKLFRRGLLLSEYKGPSDSAAIVEFMRSKHSPSSQELLTTREVQSFLDYEELTVIGFFEDENSKMFEDFQKLSGGYNDRVRFGHSFSADINAKYSYQNEVVLFREPKFQTKFEPGQMTFKGTEVTEDSLKEWLTSNIHGLVGHRTRKNADDFNRGSLVVVYYDVDYERNAKGTNYWRNRVVKVAKSFVDSGANVTFAISNANEFKIELELFGLKTKKLPVAAAKNTNHEKFPMNGDFSVESFEKFVEDFLGGKMRPFLKSEPIPDSNDGPVKIVVAETFEEIVKDTSKDVLIELYSPMCGHCIVLESKYNDLALKLQDEPDLVIAKLDGTANEVPAGYGYQGFPTIYFAPKGSKDEPTVYDSELEIDAFVKFLARESTEPLKGFDRKGRPRNKMGKKRIAETEAAQKVEL